MSKGAYKPESVVDNLSDQSTSQTKKLRFHPYYYQGRKGSYYLSDKRTSVKVTKIEKNDDELVLTITGRQKDKIQLKGYWEDIEFDYYSISCPSWKVNFPRK